VAISLQYVAKETATNLKRNVFITFAAVLVVSVSLYLVGVVLIASFAVDRALTLQTRKVEVAVFLNREVTPEERDSIQRDLLAMPEVGSVEYESKQDAYDRFKILFRDEPEIVENTTADALPESFRVKLKDPNQFEVVADRLQGRTGISEIRDERKFLRRFLAVVRDIRTLGAVVVGLLILAAAVLIATTIRMAIFARRREVAIMKLVGATNWFIRIPFILEGIFAALVGALMSGAVVVGLNTLLFQRIADNFVFLGPVFQFSGSELGGVLLLLVAVGCLVGIIGSTMALRRFLEV
jgi:cell division transport system permease protein